MKALMCWFVGSGSTLTCAAVIATGGKRTRCHFRDMLLTNVGGSNLILEGHQGEEPKQEARAACDGHRSCFNWAWYHGDEWDSTARIPATIADTPE